MAPAELTILSLHLQNLRTVDHRLTVHAQRWCVYLWAKPSFALLAYAAFALPIKLPLYQAMSFFTFSLLIVISIWLWRKWASGCVGLSCSPSLNHDTKQEIRSTLHQAWCLAAFCNVQEERPWNKNCNIYLANLEIQREGCCILGLLDFFQGAGVSPLSKWSRKVKPVSLLGRLSCAGAFHISSPMAPSGLATAEG